jgi:lysophospholipase L1-like esterase
MKLVYICVLALIGVCASERWITTWGTAHTESGNTIANTVAGIPAPPQVFSYQTIRMVVHTSIGGNQVRVRLSNAYPEQATPTDNLFITVARANIAYQDSGASIIPSTITYLTFGGSPSVIIPRDADVYSDTVYLNITQQTNLAISMYIIPTSPDTAGVIYTSRHAYTEQTSYIAGQTGDYSDMPSGVMFTIPTTQWFLVTAVEVFRNGSTVVALGDSITEGFCSNQCTLDTNTRYTDYLAGRLLNAGKEIGVMNAGLSGNQLYYDSVLPRDGSIPVFPSGRSAMSRFGRDVSDVAGVKFVICLLGINDLIYGLVLDPYPVSLDPNYAQIMYNQIIFAYRQLIHRARVRWIKIIGGTLIPYSGSSSPTRY